MTEISNTKLRRLDVTLLLVFLGLLRHRKAVTVAAELGLTQSAVSQALRRLRDIFGEELFLRRPHGMEPTAVARALEDPVSRAIDALRGAIGNVSTFEPKNAQGIIRVAALDAEQAVLIPSFAARLSGKAPGLRLSVLPLGRAGALTALEDGRVDLALGFLPAAPHNICNERLYEDTFVVAGTPSALPDAPEIDLNSYCAAEHILVSPGGDMTGVVDDLLNDVGLQRSIMLGLPAFMPALSAAASSGALVTMPARIAHSLARGFGLVLAKTPIEISGFGISTYWHRRNAQDPRTLWLRIQLRDQVADWEPSPDFSNRQ